MARYIVHIDMDAFFAAVEERDNPALKGKPIVVGADPKGGRGRGVVSTCSYEARKYGIHSAMPISTAYRKCPGAVFLPVDIDKYSAVSNRIYGILIDFTPDIEPVGIDEAFLDITGTYRFFGSPGDTCLAIKRRIAAETRLTASVGLAPTKMAAKIASDLKKPDGFVEVTEETLLEFLRPLDISRIWGLGKKTEPAFRAAGINTIGDLADRGTEEMARLFGRNGLYFRDLARGIDGRAVETEYEEKSVSNEHTFGTDTADDELVSSTLMGLCEKVSNRLRDAGKEGKTVTLKIRLGGFETFTRAKTIPVPTNHADQLYKEIKGLYGRFDRKGKNIRLVGVKISGLSLTARNKSLFKDSRERKAETLHRVMDSIRLKFGEEYIHRAQSGRVAGK
ncbi:MAG: DNA polymerase IV [Candidatus Omnitrophota bacterium]